MTHRLLSVALVLLLVAVGAPMRAAENEATNVQLTLLTNEGLLIRFADKGLLIDAFVAGGDAGRSPEPATTAQDMLAGLPPVSSIPLAIVSHPHREHFDVMIAGRFLENHGETVLVSTREVIRTIRDGYAGYPAIQDRLREIHQDGGKTTTTFSGITIDFMLLSHEATAFYPERVLAHIIHLGGKKILYVGDSEMRPENWEPYDLRPQGIDVVVLPLWLFKEQSVRAVIDEHIAPKRIVVAQIPRGGMETITELSKSFPEVVFLSSPMASVQF